jgi:hypothetical protein
LELTCQRCHETLREPDRYCPACGLPQLLYVPAEGAVLSAAGENDIRDLAYPGASVALSLGSASEIAWRPALQAAIVLAIPASLLCTSMIGLVFMVAASAWAVHLYTRRIHSAGISTGAGLRIGVVTGLLASWLFVGFQGLLLWLARFPLHQGSVIDSMWAAAVLNLDQKQQETVQAGTATPASIEAAHQMRDFILSSDGKAAMAMISLCLVIAVLIFLAAVGGALGARLSAQQRRPGT